MDAGAAFDAPGVKHLVPVPVQHRKFKGSGPKLGPLGEEWSTKARSSVWPAQRHARHNLVWLHLESTASNSTRNEPGGKARRRSPQLVKVLHPIYDHTE